MKKILIAIFVNFTMINFAFAENFILTSPDFKSGDTLSQNYEFNGFGCNQIVTDIFSTCESNPNRFKGLDCSGKNMAPIFEWTGYPIKTRSFAFTIFDPDAKTGSGWWHLAIYNIPKNTQKLQNASLPANAMAIIHDGGFKSYMGLCPERGTGRHRYVFTVYALDVEKLDLPPIASPALLSHVIRHHTIAKSQLYGFYERK